ncbi:MAG TPA: DUF5916 domain-containing protein, partial [Thermoanaerobaculia bacterium]|nr:DUF5916 domain-containing protein [Thermoanaerobaculia bacterium]
MGSSGQIRISPPRVAKGPDVDGVLDDEVWAMAAVLDSFTHSRPVEGVRDTLGTLAMVCYDDENLYIAFHARDNPRAVQAPVVPRDQVWQGDWVGVSIDTYNDQQKSFFLCSNPVGIQMDGVDQEGRDSDMAPDFQYTSRGRTTGDGYDVEMAIPFKTLRFAPGENITFGFQAIRDVRRTGGHLYWAPVSRNVNSYHSQIGSLQGLSGIRPGRNVEINPTHTTSTLGERRDAGMEFDEPRGRFGLGAKVGLTSNLIADVAMTPDFSQVEADAGVVDINERFAIFFPEKRPFFLEGSDIFTTPINLVYTRRIVDPLYGSKLTGKVGRTSIGVLNSSDRSAADGIEGFPDASNRYFDKNANYTIARFKQDIFKSSNVGILLGDRTQEDQYNRGAGVDGRLRWSDKYSLTFQGAHSWARDRDFRPAIAALSPAEQANVPAELLEQNGRSSEGNTYFLEMARDTRPLSMGGNVYGYSPEFAADMGFVRRTDLSAFSTWVRPHLWGKEKQWYTGIHFPMYYERNFTYDGQTPIEDVISLSQEINFPRNSWAGMEHVRRFIRHNGTDFKDLYRHAVWAGSERYQTLRAGALYVWGEQVVFAETMRGRDQRWEFWTDFRFGPQFDGGVFLRGSTVWRGDKDSKFAEAFIPRLRVSYQFSKELSLRLIGEMQSRKSYDTLDALVSENNVFTPDVLMSYYVRPGTVIYLGYGSILEGQERDLLQPVQSSVFT